MADSPPTGTSLADRDRHGCSASIGILVVDDHAVLRRGLAAMISAEKDMHLVAEAGSGREAIDMHRRIRPDITLMDLRLPDIDGVDAIVAIRTECQAARVIVLTTYSGDVQARRALEAGAKGYLIKASLRNDLIDAIRAVHAGRGHVPTEVASEIAEHSQEDRLTDREIEVLKGVAHGYANKIIASTLGISEETVKTHMRSILAKLFAKDRTHAVMIALKRGYLNI